MKAIFWNGEQCRLRTFWRLLIQALLFGLLLVAGALGLSLLAGPGFRAWLATHPGGADLAADPMALPQALLTHPTYRLVVMALTVVALLGSVWLAGRFVDRRRFVDFGFHLQAGWWLDLGFGLALGALLMGSIFLVEWAAGWVTITGVLQAGQPGQAFLPAILSALVAFIAVGFYEELFSRGYQLRNLAEGLNGRLLGARGGLLLAWLLSSLVFGLLHGANPGATPVSTANIVVAGLMLGLGYLLTGELALPIGLHIAWNFFEGNVFGFPTSGAEAGATFIAIVQGGPSLWTGGAFGPEAGLLGLVGMLACCLLIAGWVRWRRGRTALYRALADPPQRAAAQRVESAAGS